MEGSFQWKANLWLFNVGLLTYLARSWWSVSLENHWKPRADWDNCLLKSWQAALQELIGWGPVRNNSRWTKQCCAPKHSKWSYLVLAGLEWLLTSACPKATLISLYSPALGLYIPQARFWNWHGWAKLRVARFLPYTDGVEGSFLGVKQTTW